MKTDVVAAERSFQGALRNLFQLYAHDFSEILPLDVDETGRFKEEPSDAYWTDPRRFPLLLRVEERLAGFALIHRGSRLSGATDVWDMAEFFVLRRYRRASVGTSTAHRIFAMHAGEWEVRQRNANLSATQFWRKAIATYTQGRFTEERLDDERWHGPVQRFTSHGSHVPLSGVRWAE